MSKNRTINRGNKDFSGQVIGFGFLIFPLFHVCFSRSLFGTDILTLFSRFYMRWSFFVHFLSSVPCIVFCHLMKRLRIWSNFHLLKFAVQLFPRKVRCQNQSHPAQNKNSNLDPKWGFSACLFWGSTVYAEHSLLSLKDVSHLLDKNTIAFLHEEIWPPSMTWNDSWV